MKTYCLCLPEYPDKIEAATKHFTDAGVGNVEFFWGINATAAGLDGLSTVNTYEIDNPGSGYRMGPKPTGIWLSHYMLLNHIMHTNAEHAMILEDDAKFEDGWKPKLEQALKDVPSNFDFLHPGYCCAEGHPRTHVKGDVYETKHAQCTHCYVVRRGAIPFVLGRLRKIWSPIDIAFVFEVFPHLRTYAIMPRLVSQFNTVIPP